MQKYCTGTLHVSPTRLLLFARLRAFPAPFAFAQRVFVTSELQIRSHPRPTRHGTATSSPCPHPALQNRNTSQVSVLMSRQAQHHPAALTRRPHTLAQVLSAPSVAPVTGILECARRSDGGAAVLLASTRFLTAHGLQDRTCPVVISGAEASGPLFPPAEISESMFSCDDAARAAYALAHLGPSDIDFFGLYDCFPICFIRAVEGKRRGAGDGPASQFFSAQVL